MKAETLSAKDICHMLGVVHKTFRRLVLSGDIKAESSGYGRSREYRVEGREFGHFLCVSPNHRRKFLKRYLDLRAVGDPSTAMFTPFVRYLKEHRLTYSIKDVSRICCISECAVMVWIRNGVLKRDVDDYYVTERYLAEQIDEQWTMRKYMPDNWTPESLRSLYLGTFYI